LQIQIKESAMRSLFSLLAVVTTLGLVVGTRAETIQGSYGEIRSTPRRSTEIVLHQDGQPSHAVLAWQIRQGAYDGEKLDGQIIMAVVTAEPSLGATFGHTKTVFFVEDRATESQQKALVHLAKDLAPAVIHDAGTVTKAKLDVRIAEGCGCGAAVLECPLAKVRTRKLTDADQPALGKVVEEKPLGNVFSSNQSFATEFTLAGEPIAASRNITAFTGGFSK
jgi:hypothetical protein